VLGSEFGASLYRSVQAALAPGVHGWTGDDVSISTRSRSGTAATIGSWRSDTDAVWSTRSPHARADRRDHDGHLTVVAQPVNDVHGWLAQYL
jgi:hypothetical protein